MSDSLLANSPVSKESTRIFARLKKVKKVFKEKYIYVWAEYIYQNRYSDINENQFFSFEYSFNIEQKAWELFFHIRSEIWIILVLTVGIYLEL